MQLRYRDSNHQEQNEDEIHCRNLKYCKNDQNIDKRVKINRLKKLDLKLYPNMCGILLCNDGCEKGGS